MTLEVAVSRLPTDAKTVVARKRENWAIFSETGERFNTVRDERIKLPTRHLPSSSLEYYTLPISSKGLGNQHTELEYCQVAIKRASE
jgi:hypothetical protein